MPIKLGLILSLLIITVLFFACCLSIWEKYPQDNIIEEIVEDVIEQKTNLDLDLSPYSPEKTS